MNMVLVQILPSIQSQSLPKLIHTSFEQSLAELYIIILEEHLQVALEVLKAGICSSL
jgi:hypothetical protein